MATSPPDNSEAAASERRFANNRFFRSGDDIDDPLRHDDDLARRFAVERLLYEVERQRGSFDGTLIRVAGDCQIAALLAVDLHRQRDLAVDDQGGIEIRPGMV